MFSLEFFYQPHNTRRLLLDIHREQIDSITTGASPAHPTRAETLTQDLISTQSWTPRGAFNRLGRLLVEEVASGYRVEERLTRIQADHAATVLV